MTPLTIEWATKAEADYAVVQRELRARKAPNYDAACFHAQQCAEKYLKARLQEAVIPFPKTHDLGELIDLLAPIEPGWAAMRPDAKTLTYMAVEVRYPGFFATKDHARESLRTCEAIRAAVRQSLGLS